MKKIILILLILLGLNTKVFSAPISVSSFLTADDVTIAHLEDQRSTFQGAINSADGGLLQSATVTTAKLDANANPENRWNEAFNDFVYTGLLPPTSTSLTSVTTAGTAYIEGVRVVKDATSNTYTLSTHTFLDLSSNGTYTYNEVAIQAAEPALSANSIRLARISTDATTVAEVRDDRTTAIASIVSTSIVTDDDNDTKVEVQKNTDEDKIRFTAANTQEAQIDANGLKLKAGADVNEISIDTTLGGNSDDAVPTEKAVKTYIDTGNRDARIKAWITFDGTGVISIYDSYNVSGIVDNGVGDYTVTWDTDFANTNYCVVGMSNNIVEYYSTATKLVGSVRIITINTTPANVDTDPISLIAIGDQ